MSISQPSKAFQKALCDISVNKDDFNKACNEWECIGILKIPLKTINNVTLGITVTPFTHKDFNNILPTNETLKLPNSIRNHCICGQKNIVYHCLIRNNKNGYHTLVGNNCINHITGDIKTTYHFKKLDNIKKYLSKPTLIKDNNLIIQYIKEISNDNIVFDTKTSRGIINIIDKCLEIYNKQNIDNDVFIRKNILETIAFSVDNPSLKYDILYDIYENKYDSIFSDCFDDLIHIYYNDILKQPQWYIIRILQDEYEYTYPYILSDRENLNFILTVVPFYADILKKYNGSDVGTMDDIFINTNNCIPGNIIQEYIELIDNKEEFCMNMFQQILQMFDDPSYSNLLEPTSMMVKNLIDYNQRAVEKWINLQKQDIFTQIVTIVNVYAEELFRYLHVECDVFGTLKQTFRNDINMMINILNNPSKYTIYHKYISKTINDYVQNDPLKSYKYILTKLRKYIDNPIFDISIISMKENQITCQTRTKKTKTNVYTENIPHKNTILYHFKLNNEK